MKKSLFKNILEDIINSFKTLIYLTEIFIIGLLILLGPAIFTQIYDEPLFLLIYPVEMFLFILWFNISDTLESRRCAKIIDKSSEKEEK